MATFLQKYKEHNIYVENNGTFYADINSKRRESSQISLLMKQIDEALRAIEIRTVRLNQSSGIKDIGVLSWKQGDGTPFVFTKEHGNMEARGLYVPSADLEAEYDELVNRHRKERDALAQQQNTELAEITMRFTRISKEWVMSERRRIQAEQKEQGDEAATA